MVATNQDVVWQVECCALLDREDSTHTMDWISDPTIWSALLTLTALEIVLGVDNVIFISILSSKLPVEQQNRARIVGLAAAMLMRIALLFAISWLVGLTEPWFELFGHEFSGRDLPTEC
jgi:predicted tellurium resistance membrane protein TerC